MAKKKTKPVGVYAKVRYAWLMEHNPDFCKRMEAEGKFQQYLDDLQRRYCKKADALTEFYTKKIGMTPEQADVDFVKYLLDGYRVQQMVRDDIIPMLQQ